jgi:hypothetical protein
MTFAIRLTDEARETYEQLAGESLSRFNKVRKALGLMETNLRSAIQQTHEWVSVKGPGGEKMFEAYVEQRTPGAYRILWYYGPEPGVITVTSIMRHP